MVINSTKLCVLQQNQNLSRCDDPAKATQQTIGKAHIALGDTQPTYRLYRLQNFQEIPGTDLQLLMCRWSSMAHILSGAFKRVTRNLPLRWRYILLLFIVVSCQWKHSLLKAKAAEAGKGAYQTQLVNKPDMSGRVEISRFSKASPQGCRNSEQLWGRRHRPAALQCYSSLTCWCCLQVGQRVPAQ